MRNHTAHNLDAHYVCVEREKLGLPTPSLGDECPECTGRGHKAKAALGPMLFADGNSPGSAARAINAWAPKCPKCDGRGSILGEGATWQIK